MTGLALPAPDRHAATVLAPLVRLLLNVRVVVLLLVSLAAAPSTLDALGVVVLMAGTSVLPLLLWTRIGDWVLRHPSAMALDLAVSVIVLGTAGVDTPFTLYVVTTAVLAGILYARAGGVVLAILLLAGYGMAATVYLPGAPVAATLVVPALLPGGALLGAELRRLLIDRDVALRAARSGLVRAVTAEERARLAREMHDSVAKTLHGIVLSAVSLDALTRSDPERARHEAVRIRHAAEIAASETRALLSDLRADDPRRSLHEVVREELALVGETEGLETALHVVGDGELAPRARHELLQILREALCNVSRHARAQRVEVELELGCSGIRLHVRDDGEGFELPADLTVFGREGHHGLVGLRERAQLLGGELTLRSAPGQGTHLELRCPGHDVEEVPA